MPLPPRLLFVVIFVSADQHRNVGMVKDVVADAAQERAADLAHPPGSRDDERRILVLCHLTDDLAWAATNALYFSSNLWEKKYEV